jgi:Mrp family chromosome partitioning ATPase
LNLAAIVRGGAMADEFSRLRRDLAAMASNPRHLVVLGAAGREGVTTVAVNLALAMAGSRGNAQVLLVDGNLRAPSLESALGLAPGPGLRDWDLSSNLPVRSFEVGERSLHVLTAGGSAGSATNGVTIEKRLTAACLRVRNDYPASVWDSPPVLRFSDGLDLAADCDGSLVVIEMDQTRAGGLQYIRSALDRRHAVLLGSVLNRSGRYWPRAPKHSTG